MQPYVLKHGGALVAPPANVAAGNLSLREWQLWLDDATLLQKEREVVAKAANVPAVEYGLFTADVQEKSKVVGMDWKAKYKLRHNWRRGVCRVEDVDLGNATVEDAMSNRAVKFHEGYLFVADLGGVAVYRMDHDRKPQRLCHLELDPSLGKPTCLALDEEACDDYVSKIEHEDGVDVAVGFSTGAVTVIKFKTIDGTTASLTMVVDYRCRSKGVKHIAIARSYITFVTQSKELYIYHMPPTKMSSLKLVSFLQCEKLWNITALSLRHEPLDDIMIASIIFSFVSYSEGDTVCLQEILIDTTTQRVSSTRTAEPTPPSFLDVSFARSSCPTSTCYKYPFLITSHENNTLNRYLVVSNKDDVVISPSYRMWGHTNAVMGVGIRRRTAVSIDRKGEMRVWDLQNFRESVRVRLRATDESKKGGFGGFIAFGEDEIVTLETSNDEEVRSRLVMHDFT